MDNEAAVPVGVDDDKTEDHDPVRKQDGEQNGKQDVDSSFKRNSRNWVEILKSPTDMPQFSPSLMLDGNLHGLGLQLATHRSKMTGKFGRRMAVYLMEMASAYDDFGVLLSKASRSLHPGTLNFPESLEEQTNELYQTVHAFAKDSRRYAEFYRVTIVVPLQTLLAINRTSIDTHGQRYVAARVQCLEARKRALAARRKYAKAIRNVEKYLGNWKGARRTGPIPEDNENPLTRPDDEGVGVKTVEQGDADGEKESINASRQEDTDDEKGDADEPEPWELVLREYGKEIPEETEILIDSIHVVRLTRIRYEEMVENENHSVEFAQKMEAAALEETQKLEEERVEFFSNSIVSPIFAVDEKKIGEISLAPQSFDVRPSSIDELKSLKKGKDLLTNIFVRQKSHEEGKGVAEAEALGLPRECGVLRDDVKLLISQVDLRTKEAETLADFIDAFGNGAVAYESILKENQDARQHSSLGEMAFSAVGSQTAEVCKTIVHLFEQEADVVGSIVQTFDSIREEKLQSFLDSVQKDLKLETDVDDSNWKTLCDTARVESRAAARYRQIRANQEKARERLQSVDALKIETAASEDEPPPGIQKSRRTVGQALLAGGEAVKKFQGQARLALAKNQLNEAELNAAKEQQALDEATSTRSKAIENYKNVTTTRIEKLKHVVVERVAAYQEIAEAICKGIQEIANIRRVVRTGTVADVKTTTDLLREDVEQWVFSTEEKIKEEFKKSEMNDTPNNIGTFNTGFQLSVKLIHSDDVENLRKLKEAASVPPEFLTQDDEPLSVEASEDDQDASIISNFSRLSDSYHERNSPDASQAEEINTTTEITDEEAVDNSLPIPPDTVLDKMHKVLSKSMRGVSIKQVYDKAWSESVKPFYEPWLVSEECFDIDVPKWESAEPGSRGFINPWCKEHYTHKRIVTFKFKRTSHLYIGPPVATVKQTHFCRVEGNSKCVIVISAIFIGVPYADTFGLEMRWVARREGSEDLQIDVGMVVDFKKKTILKNQLQSGLITETKNVHIRMYNAINKACSTGPDTAIEPEKLEEEKPQAARRKTALPEDRSAWAQFHSITSRIPVDKNLLFFTAAILAYPILWNFFASIFDAPGISMNEAQRLNMRIDQLQGEVRELRITLDRAIELLKKDH